MFSMEWFPIYRGAKFFGFPRWRLFRMTFHVIFMTKTFYRMSNTNFKKFTSIRPRVAEKMNFKNANTYIRHTYVTDCFVKIHFLSNPWSDWHEIFEIGVTHPVEWFSHKYDIEGHVEQAPPWKNRKTLHLYISETTPWKTFTPGSLSSTPRGE